MNQFEVLIMDGRRWLTVVNTDQYDFLSQSTFKEST